MARVPDSLPSASAVLHTPHDLARILIFPPKQAVSAVKDAEAAFMYRLVTEQNLSRTLEVGFAYAKSAAHIMAASRARHVAMDPFQAAFDDVGLTNIERIGLSENLEFYRDHSHNVLPQLRKEGRNFDFAFIDGGHRFDEIFVDVYFSDLLLLQGGYLLLHDTWMRSTCLVESFLKHNRSEYRQVRTGLTNLSLFQKCGEDSRDWRHFKEFYSFKSLLTYRIVNRLLNRKSVIAQ